MTSNHKKHSSLVKSDWEGKSVGIKGLVLAGGKSQRMGHDKGAIQYYGQDHREYTADLVNTFCKEVFLSVRPGQELESNYPQIEDTFLNLGPYGGILSAFRDDPNSAWLVLATDLPLVDSALLSELVSQRNPEKAATCFYNPETDLPEPLITIWEPRAYPLLLQNLAEGYSCPRKSLIRSEKEMIQTSDPSKLLNVNKPEELEQIKMKIQNKMSGKVSPA